MARKNRTHVAVGDSPTPPGLKPKYLTKQEFGRRVYTLMANKGWNQSELARAAKIARDDVSRYVRGVSLPTDEKLKALTRALGVEVENLLPNYVAHAIEDDHPPFMMKTSNANPNVVWLQVNRMVMLPTALKIAELLNNDNAPHGQASSR